MASLMAPTLRGFHEWRSRLLRVMASSLAGVALIAQSPSEAANDYSNLAITSIRVGHIDTVSCSVNKCLVIYVVILFTGSDGRIWSISTNFPSDGLAAALSASFGPDAAYATRIIGDAIQAATSDSDPVVAQLAKNLSQSLAPSRDYRVRTGTSLSADVERAAAILAHAYRAATGGTITVIPGPPGGFGVDESGMSSDQKAALQSAAVDLPGAAAQPDPNQPDVLLVSLRPMKLSLAMEAFIPGQVQGAITVPPGSPYAGKTGISTPVVSYCFLTDQRSFDASPAASHRLRLAVNIDMLLSTMRYSADAGQTVEVQCTDGKEKCLATASVGSVNATNFSVDRSTPSNPRYFVTLEAMGHNPCFVASVFAQIKWKLVATLNYNVATGRVRLSADGLITRFPAFEMYAGLNGGPTATVFREGPDPGASAAALFWDADKSITAFVDIP